MDSPKDEDSQFNEERDELMRIANGGASSVNHIVCVKPFLKTKRVGNVII